MRTIARGVWYLLWALNGYVGPKVSLDLPFKVTVLIAYYSPARTKHIASQVRNLLKCSFVDKIVLSNHNPEMDIRKLVKTTDKRLVVMNQETRRGCGHRWFIAAELSPEYLVVLDDDVLLFPSQVAKLARHLICEPETPHGFTGMRRASDATLEYHQREDAPIDFLCEVYAVTRRHLAQYRELRKLLIANGVSSEMIDFSMDFMVVSRAGSGLPRIHKTFRLLRCDTYRTAGIAVHKEAGFDKRMSIVNQSLEEIGAQSEGRSAGSEFLIKSLSENSGIAGVKGQLA